MNTSHNHFDAIEQLIFEEGIRIQMVDVRVEDGLLVLTLNTKAVLRLPLSAFPALKTASFENLKNYELIAGGTGVHWPALDEDLSLKGFLQQELKRAVSNTLAA